MPGFGDSAVIVLLALLLFGPKKLPVLARQLGKLMGDFRRASNEFRSQMEEELRISEQADRQKQIAAMEAAAPATPALTASTEAAPVSGSAHSAAEPSIASAVPTEPVEAPPAAEPLPIATSGEISIMPPSTGLPVAKSALGPLLDAIPESTSNGHSHVPVPEHETVPKEEAASGSEARPWMI